MMKKTGLLSVGMIALILSAMGQSTSRYNDNWYFTNNNALKFTSGSPVEVTGCPLNDASYGGGTLEANSAISDGNGDLLFYTDGISVFDSTNSTMPNGAVSLNGNYSATSGCVIAHVPGSCNEYYIFHLRNITGTINDLYYSRVDMSLPGNGTIPSPLGDVVTGQTNMLITTDTLAEKMLAIQKGITEDYWIVVRSALRAEFYAFEITSAGVNTTPVVSTFSSYLYPYGSTPTPIGGWLAVSPQNDAIAEANVFANSYLYDFDNSTGSVSNQDTLAISTFPISPYEFTYGVEFSPNGDYIYMGAKISTASDIQVLRFDRTAGFGNVKGTRLQTYITPVISSNEIVLSMHLQKDGIIYFNTSDQTSMSRITDPNNWASPGVDYASFPVTGGIVSSCLSNDFHYFQEPILPPTLTSADSNICPGDSTMIGCFGCDTIEGNYFWEPAAFISNPNSAAAQTIPLFVTDTFIVYVLRCGDTVTSDTVIVNVTGLSAGLDRTLSICQDMAPIDLLQWMGGDPDSLGVFSPALASGTTIYDPAVDGAGAFTYTHVDACGHSSVTTIGLVSCNVCPGPLVPNPSFEDQSYCPGGSGQMAAVDSWDKPPLTGSSGTSDYFNECDFTVNNPNTGNGYVGFFTYINFIPNAREYVQAQLTSPLQAGECYTGSMYISLRPGSGYALDSVGMFVSVLAPPSVSGNMIDTTPQIATNVGNMVADSNWVQITGSFIATGGEEYVTIGVFAPESNLTINSTGGPSLSSFYLVDDVCITLIPHDTTTTDLVADTSLCTSTLITIKAPLGYASYEWRDTLGNTLSTTDSLNITPSGFNQVILYALDESTCPHMVNIDTINITLGVGTTPIIFTPNSWYCSTDNITDLNSDIGDIWFSDASLTTQVGVDSFFTPPVIIGTSTYYVIDTTGGCYSLADSVTVTFDSCSYPCSSIQNQLTNGDFETFSSCPTNISQMTNATGWLNIQSNSNDYFNQCDFVGKAPELPGYNGADQNMFINPEGNGYAGFIVGGAVPGNSEGFGQAVQLKKCIEYTIQFRMAHSGATDSIEGNICIYGGNSASASPCMSGFTSLGCVQGDSIDENWRVFEFTFIPPDNFTHLVIAGECPSTTGLSNQYVYIDDMYLCEKPCLATWIQNISIVPIADDTCGMNTGSMTVDFTTQCYTGFNFEWKLGAVVMSTDSIATGLAAGLYNLGITDSNCSTYMIGPSISAFNPITSIVITPSSASICTGASISLLASGATNYSWSPSTGLSCTSCPNPVATPASTTTYQVVGSTGSCSDSTTITITVSSSINTLDTALMCAGDSLFLGGAWQTTAGNYKDTLTASGGCDSIVATNLSIIPPNGSSNNTNICPGDSAFIQGAWQTLAGTYFDTVPNSAGCDSVITTNLTLSSPISTSSNSGICPGDSMFLAGAWQTIAGSYVDSFIASGGCDSLHTIILAIDPTYYMIDAPLSICIGSSISIYGFFESTSGTYYDSLTSVNGCDSIHSTVLTVNAVYNIVDAPISICAGDSSSIYGIFQSTAGTYYDSLTTVVGCDSIHSTVMTILATSSSSNNAIICPGDSLFVQGAYQTMAGTYYDTLTSILGCDSVIETTLTIDPVYFISSSVSICQGDSVQLPNGSYATTSGSYTDSLTTGAGCDSVITLTVTIDSTTFTANSDTICSGDTVIIGNSFYTDAGTYYDTLMAVNGCDSIIRTTLTVNASYEFWNTVPICSGDTVMIDSVFYSGPGTYYDSLQTAKGCDSVFILEIIVNATYETWDTMAICSGDSIMIGGAFYSDAGTYYDSMLTVEGCDSVFIINVTVDTVFDATITPVNAICANTGILILTAADGVGTWSGTGITNADTGYFDPSIAGPGAHEIIYVIGGSCGDSDTINISVYEVPSLSILGVAESCDGENDGSVYLAVTGGAMPYAYLWDNPGSSTTDTLMALPPGTYTVVVTDSNFRSTISLSMKVAFT
ncbi:MAG TPA: hypothetical protein EYN71_11435 [Flavobacteriales bacterium]|nr:hypothetical protein [Flavobacteriales bacterium]